MYYSISFKKRHIFLNIFLSVCRRKRFLRYNLIMSIIEAVPNISEGKDPAKLRALAEVLRAAKGVKLLGVDANPCANRTVFTLAGEAGAVLQALFDFIALAVRLIDMRTQHGTHPRLGAVDVCPLIPLQDITLAQTAQLAKTLGQRVGERLQIPVYLYEAAAANEQRQNLAFIRKGEYEHLAQKLHILPPDFGPKAFSPRTAQTGACIIGARNILIAFNVNLNTQDPTPAKAIAAKIRQSGGGMPGLKAIGWYMPNFGRAQVSCNITDFHAAPLSAVYEACQKQAAALGLQATSCELVGLAPLQAVLEAGHHYAPAETDRQKLIRAAAEGLHLNEVKPFSAEEQILEIKAGLID